MTEEKEKLIDFVGDKANEIEKFIGENISIHIEIRNKKDEEILSFSQFAD